MLSLATWNVLNFGDQICFVQTKKRSLTNGRRWVEIVPYRSVDNESFFRPRWDREGLSGFPSCA